MTKADSEQLARSIAEEQYSDLEKEKIMKELEIKEMMARHKQELTEKDATIASVSKIFLSFLILIKLLLSSVFLKSTREVPQMEMKNLICWL